MKTGWTIRTNANKLKNVLSELDKTDVIDFAIVLYRKYFLNEDDINYTKLSDILVGLLGMTIGISYNNTHTTPNDKKAESYDDWVKKMAKNALKL